MGRTAESKDLALLLDADLVLWGYQSSAGISIPNGSDFTNITQEFLEEVEKKLNERPGKRHGFLSPDAVFSRMTGLDAGKFV